MIDIYVYYWEAAGITGNLCGGQIADSYRSYRSSALIDQAYVEA